MRLSPHIIDEIKEKNMAAAVQVSSGQRFGRWTVLRETGPVVFASGGKHRMVECQCDCGKTRDVNLPSLSSGMSRSCGCLTAETTVARSTTHGQTGKATRTSEYRTWVNMRERCYRPTNNRFHLYGAIGITVCDRWRTSFENFVADMGPKPSPKHSIDRWPNPSGNYEPGNCRWATAGEQAKNRRNISRGRTGVFGVYCHVSGKFVAKKDGRYLGIFHTIEEAAAARASA